MFTGKLGRMPKLSENLLKSIVARDDVESFRTLWHLVPDQGQLKVNLKREEVGCDRALMAADSPDWIISVPDTTHIFQFVKEQFGHK